MQPTKPVDPLLDLGGVVASVALGAGLGALSLLGDGAGVRLLNGLANATSPWIITAFVSGAMQRTHAGGAIGGAATLAVGVTAYYAGLMASGSTSVIPFFVAWLVAALAAGSLFGTAGHRWIRRDERWRMPSVQLLSGTLLAEAAYRMIAIEFWTGISWESTYVQVAAADAVAAVATLLLLQRSSWLRALAALPVSAAPILAVFLTADRILRWLGTIASG